MAQLRLGRTALAGAVVIAMALFGACGDDDDSGGSGRRSDTTQPGEKAAATVVVKNLDYKPVSVTIDAGELVTWRFDDHKVPHDVKGDDFHSPVETSGTWSHRFEKSGTYQYNCTVHPFMKGTVEVR